MCPIRTDFSNGKIKCITRWLVCSKNIDYNSRFCVESTSFGRQQYWIALGSQVPGKTVWIQNEEHTTIGYAYASKCTFSLWNRDESRRCRGYDPSKHDRNGVDHSRPRVTIDRIVERWKRIENFRVENLKQSFPSFFSIFFPIYFFLLTFELYQWPRI